MTQTESGKADALPVGTRTLLGCSLAAGPLYLTVGAAQALTRDGFDVRRHALSLLSNGDYGWIQVANFVLSGALVIAGAVGVRRRLASGKGATWASVLRALYGVGLIGAGIFIADPGQGFPPGVQVDGSGMSRAGVLHFVFGALGFYALIAACLVFARRFWTQGNRVWATYSMVSGLGFLASFGAIASGSTSSAVMLSFYAAVAWIWIWHAALSAHLIRSHASARFFLT